MADLVVDEAGAGPREEEEQAAQPVPAGGQGSEEDDESERMSGHIVEEPVGREARPRN